MRPWRVKMPTQNLLRLLLLLMRIVLATICCRFWSWGLVKKLNFCSDFEHKVCQDFEDEVQASFAAGVWPVFFCWCFVEVMLNPRWILVEILKLGLVKILNFKFCGDADVWLRFWSWCLVKICVWTCDMNSTLRSYAPLTMFLNDNIMFHSIFGCYL